MDHAKKNGIPNTVGSTRFAKKMIGVGVSAMDTNSSTAATLADVGIRLICEPRIWMADRFSERKEEQRPSASRSSADPGIHDVGASPGSRHPRESDARTAPGTPRRAA